MLWDGDRDFKCYKWFSANIFHQLSKMLFNHECTWGQLRCIDIVSFSNKMIPNSCILLICFQKKGVKMVEFEIQVCQSDVLLYYR